MHWPTNAFLSRWLRNLTVAILVLVPFHAFLTVWFSSIFGQYTAVRLWKETLLLIALLVTISLIASRHTLQKLVQPPLLRKLLLLIVGYVGLQLVLGAFGLASDKVTTTALGYAYVSNVRFLLFFCVCLVVGFLWRDWLIAHWRKLLLWPAAVVVGFGLLQFLVLPADFLKHFGYGPDTIAPYIAVDQKPEYGRVQSTLRGPNPLGAYMVVIITGLAGLLAARRKDPRLLGALLVAFVVCVGTYSRSAWLGVLLALIALGWILANKQQRQWLGVGAISLAILGAGLIFVLRNNDLIQNVVFHTDETSQSDMSSNENRSNALTGGFEDMLHEPLGRGPGTAGPASVYNDDHETRLAENYFLQVGQEVGIIGLTVFIGICAMVSVMLWRLREKGVLPIVLFTSFIGLTFVNLLSHAWADDTLAYVWWGFAGLAIGAYTVQETKQAKSRAKKAL